MFSLFCGSLSLRQRPTGRPHTYASMCSCPPPVLRSTHVQAIDPPIVRALFLPCTLTGSPKANENKMSPTRRLLCRPSFEKKPLLFSGCGSEAPAFASHTAFFKVLLVKLRSWFFFSRLLEDSPPTPQPGPTRVFSCVVARVPSHLHLFVVPPSPAYSLPPHHSEREGVGWSYTLSHTLFVSL